MSRLFCLVSVLPDVHAADLYGLARAAELGAVDCAKAWGLEPPALEVGADAPSLPDGCVPVVFLNDDSEPGALAVHYVDDRFEPAARVFMGASSGLNSGPYSGAEGCDHEVKEALVDPMCDQWRDHPTRPGVEVALEVCDPVQGFYTVEHGGVFWQLSNFVYPSWFEPNGQAPFDHKGLLSAPGEVGAGGYVILRDKATGETWTEDSTGRFAMKEAARVAFKPGTFHPWARSQRRLKSAAA